MKVFLPIFLLLCTVALGAEPDLAAGFRDVPNTARPLTWWHWMNGNVTKEGIRADLEDMKRAGLRGAQIFNISIHEPKGPAPYDSPEWENAVKYAMTEARELGLELSIMNGPGWSNSGGPWVTPGESMKKLVWSEQTETGPRKVSLSLPQPETVENFYRDIHVIAVPADPESSASEEQPTISAGQVGDEMPPGKTASHPWTFTFSYPKPTERCSFNLVLAPTPKTKFLHVFGTVEASADGKTFSSVHEYEFSGRAPWQPLTISFPRSSAMAFRLVANINTSDATPLISSQVEISDALRTENFFSKTVRSAIANVMPATEPLQDGAGAIAPKDVVDLTAQMKPDGTFQWDAPAGRWTILRLGYTSTGMTNHPAPEEGVGLEVDKMDKVAVQDYLEKSLGRLLGGKEKLSGIVLDSWEVGQQNWTGNFEAEFRKRRGYEMGAYLPALTGRVIGSPAETEAFLCDFRRTISDLVAEEYFRGIHEFSTAHGLKFYAEPYDGYTFNEFQCAAEVGVLMTEFWARMDLGPRVKEMSSLAHLTGRNILAGESFTAAPDMGRWRATPALLKGPGDEAFAQGLNLAILHSYVQQPRSDIWPGFSLYNYGTNFGRLNPWWIPASRDWVNYLSRCQFLLQQGRNEADILLLQSGDIDLLVQDSFPDLPPGFAADRVEPPQLLTMQAKNGRIVLPNGASYRAIVLSRRWIASTALLAHLEELVQAGVALTGVPPVAPDRLVDQRDLAKWKACVSRLWPDGKPRGPIDPGTLATESGWTPDCLFTPAKGSANISWIHRTGDSEDIYFVANSTGTPVTGTLRLRVSGKQPELWDAVTGNMAPAPVFRENPSGTEIDLALDAFESVFVVLREPPGHGAISAVTGPAGTVPLTNLRLSKGALWVDQNGTYQLVDEKGVEKSITIQVPASFAVGGPWKILFQPPLRPGFERTADHLALWNTDPDNAVKYFSGTATYTNKFAMPYGALDGNRVILNLGSVFDVANIMVNGKIAAMRWTPPFSVDVTGLVKAGENEIEIKVTDRAVNRMIGDEQLPADLVYKSRGLAAFPDWYSDPKKLAARQRETFSTYTNYTKDAPLMNAGLVGPVILSFLKKLE
jgi:hypothetical protein